MAAAINDFMKIPRQEPFPEGFRLATVDEAALLLEAIKADPNAGRELLPGQGAVLRLKNGYFFNFGALRTFYHDLESKVTFTEKLGISCSNPVSPFNPSDAALALLHACDEEDNMEELRALFDMFDKDGKELPVAKTAWMNGGSALHMCARSRRLKSLNFLLSLGGLPGDATVLEDYYGNTVLCSAAQAERANNGVVELLLGQEKCREKINHRNHAGFSALAIAVSTGHFETCKELLKAENIDLSMEYNGLKHTVLHLCVLRDAPAEDLFKVLLDDPRVSKNLLDQYDRGRLMTAFMYALQKGFSTFCKNALEKGVSLSSRDAYGNTVLHLYAVGRADREVGSLILRRLGDQGVRDSINGFNLEGLSPLMIALGSGSSDACDVLLGFTMNNQEVSQHLLDIDGTNDSNNILHFYAKGGLNKVVGTKLLEKVRELINKKNRRGQTPLQLALSEGKSDACMVFLEQENVAVEVVDGEGKTALHIYAKGGADKRVGEELLRRLGDGTVSKSINARDFSGRTPLMLALEKGNEDACHVLLSKAVGILVKCEDVDAADNNVLHCYAKGGTADARVWEKLKCGRERDVAKHINDRNSKGHTPLLRALRHNRVQAAITLVEEDKSKNVSLDVDDKEHNTVLHGFATGGCEDAELWEKLKAACGYRVNDIINAPNMKGETPLMMALRNGSEACTLLVLGDEKLKVTTDVYEKRGLTVLHYAAAYMGQKIKVLMEVRRRAWRKELLHQKDGEGKTALMVAATFGNEEFFDMLCAAAEESEVPFLDCVDKRGSNLFHFAAACRRDSGPRFLELLLMMRQRQTSGLDIATPNPTEIASSSSNNNATVANPSIPAMAANTVLPPALAFNSEGSTPLALSVLYSDVGACAWLWEKLQPIYHPSPQPALPDLAHLEHAIQSSFVLRHPYAALHRSDLPDPRSSNPSDVARSWAVFTFVMSRFRLENALRVIDINPQVFLQDALVAPCKLSIVSKLLESCPQFLYAPETVWGAFTFAVATYNIEALEILLEGKFIRSPVLTKTQPNQGTVLHVAVLAPSTALPQGKNPISGSRAMVAKLLEASRKLADCQFVDVNGETALHMACRLGRFDVARLLLKRNVQLADVPSAAGKTPLHEAAGAVDIDIVRELLELKKQREGAVLSERDVDGRTALHFAAAASLLTNEDDALDVVKLLLDEQMIGIGYKRLLLWASAANAFGTADKHAKHHKVIEYLQSEMRSEMRKQDRDLLDLAAEKHNDMMVKELINRGANMASLSRYPRYRALLKEIQRTKTKESDQPSPKDSLGRSNLAKGIAALLLNPFTAMPITIGIFGPWGMGKSSIMLQIEISMLMTIAQRNLLLSSQTQEEFPGILKEKLTRKGRMLQKDVLKLAFGKQLAGKKVTQTLSEFFNDYKSTWSPLYKSLALANRRELVKSSSSHEVPVHEEVIGEIPSLLTIRYNAWLYQGETEASAGLALTIMREMQNWMKTSQWLKLSWWYARRKNPDTMFVNLIFPVLVCVLLGGWIAWVAWKLLSLPHSENLRNLGYGSVPVSIVVITWIVLRRVISFLQPMSQRLLESVETGKEHEKRLSYQQEVIDDLLFFKEQLGKKLGFGWTILGRLWSLAVENRDYIPGTNIAKPLFSTENLRITVFVDDLDRCTTHQYVLQLLSAVNLILSVCEINVVLGMDRGMVQKALPSELDESDKEKFFEKIIQMPVDIFEPSENELKNFLNEQLGYMVENNADHRKASGNHREPSGEIPAHQVDKGISSRPMVEHEPLMMGHTSIVAIETLGPDMRCADDHHQARVINMPEIIKNDAVLVDVSQGTSRSEATQTSEQFDGSACDNQDIRVREQSLEATRIPPSDPKCQAPSRPRNTLVVEFPILVANYNESEVRAFQYLQSKARGDHKHPRNWKRLLNYHRLCWNIISQSKPEQVQNIYGWQQQLIVWVFLCYNWKKQMNDIFKNWDTLVGAPLDSNSLDYFENEDDTEGFNDKKQKQMLDEFFRLLNQGEEPSLRAIIDLRFYQLQQEWNAQSTVASGPQQPAWNQFNPMNQPPWNQFNPMNQPAWNQSIPMNQPIVCLGHEEEQKQWNELINTLSEKSYDVSMRSIQAFQKFRFQCDVVHLHWQDGMTLLVNAKGL